MYLTALLGRRDGAGGAEAGATAPAIVGGTETVAFYVAFFVWPAHQRSLFHLMAGLVMANVVIRLVWARRRL